MSKDQKKCRLKNLKMKILKALAFPTVFYRMNFDIAREARLSLIQYSMQKLINVYGEEI